MISSKGDNDNDIEVTSSQGMQHNEQRWAQCKIERLEEQTRAESESTGKLRKKCAEQEAANRRVRGGGGDDVGGEGSTRVEGHHVIQNRCQTPVP